MGKPGKRKAAKTGLGEKSPNAPNNKKQNAEKNTNKVPEGEDEVVEFEEEDENVPEGEEEDEEDSVLIASDVQLAAGGDVIEQCRVLAPDQCPRIPLCRLVPHAQVRRLHKNLKRPSQVKNTFQRREHSSYYCLKLTV